MRKDEIKNRYKRNVRYTKNLFSIIFLALVSVLSLTFCIALLLINASLRRQVDASESELAAIENEGYYTKAQTEQLVENAENEVRGVAADEIREKFKQVLTETGTTAAIKDLFSDQLVVAFDGTYHFYDISENLEKSRFLPEDFERDEKGFVRYVGNAEDIEIKNGIDVSRFQGEIDFTKVKASGIDFAMIRVGLRGSTEGAILQDDTFDNNIKNAIRAGLDVGVYFYSQAVNSQEAREEAQYVLDMLEPYNVKYPVVIDIEASESSDARTKGLDNATYSEIATTFCEMVKTSGYTPMIYGNNRTFIAMLSENELQNYPVWIADYADPMYFPYKFDMWQYTDSGKVDGIDGDVDLDLYVVPKE
ncbi:MAG: glycoside hydrolase family 25 protein [Butyrivibrio sp.]|nr:glycoside hydrolase family 25 protein [Butyrivibrio sp.]